MSTTATTHQTKWWTGGKSPFNLEYGKVMMWYFLMSDAFTFGAFLISYGSIRFSQNFWPDPNVVFDSAPGIHGGAPLLFVSIMTFILIVSSVTMVLAVHAGHKGDKQGVVKWLFWTIVGGAAFLGCQAWEWHHLITGGHAVLAVNPDGSQYLDVIGQTMGGNPWGQPVNNADALAALQTTPHETLIKLAHLSNHDLTHDQLVKMQHADLLKNINVEHLHIREKGPIAFGGYFYGITGFHGFHVFSGVVINIVMLIMTQKKCIPEQGTLPDD